MKERIPAIQTAILAHLRAAPGPVSSRDLAARFLKITAGDEETCRRLLAPFLGAVRGVSHDAARGWTCETRPGGAGEPAGAGRAVAPAPAGTESTTPPAPATEPRPGPGSPADFVAIAVEGAGPGGSGGPRVAALVPVVGGEICPEEIFPPWAAGEPDMDAGGHPETIPGSRPGGLRREDLEALIETIGDLPLVCHRVSREVDPIRAACLEQGLRLDLPVISMAKIGHLLLGLKRNHAAFDLAAAIGLESRGPDDCRGRARLVAEAFLALAPQLAARGCDTIEAILEYQDLPAPPVDMQPYAFSLEDLRALPSSPGVYRFLDHRGGILYIGKARNLRSRVGSYFTPSARATARGRAILEQARGLEVTVVASDLEAALLEAALIQDHRPPLNRQFEVHERPAPYGPRLDLAVVLPDLTTTGAPAGCTIHLLRQGQYLGRVPGAETDAGSFRRRLAAAYFAPGGDPPETTIAIDWPIVSSYLRAHRDEVNVLDFDECSSVDEAVARLAVLVRAAASGSGRVIARDCARPARTGGPVRPAG